ncbi:FecR domain-containing protein [Mucilaginibacter sp. KACC 22773]|uniref:FecR family protein n=1 Tax=Mucilaginibacter sp. KACC 22773 TaxID=3025671 RepID=UPI0023651F08|nr:FecR domain-containing protein [Mucilaginibacter sp. KACC 22773]WDF77119.1 FecR domain-containing protein [Mucilaginibacter sp. KACC 22773]
MTKKEAKDLLKRYHSGHCTPEEKQRIEAWYDMLAQSGDIQWTPEEKQLLSDELKTAIDARIKKPKGLIVYLKPALVAASILLFFGIGYLTKTHWTNTIFKPVQDTYTERIVPSGEKLTLTLSDSSVIILGGGSRVRYPENFTQKIRQVELLEGEAYFDIKHDAHRPFIVNAAGTQINVLGTAFNVRAFKFLKNVQVTVTRGKVSVKSLTDHRNEPARNVTLLPNEQVTIGKVDGEIHKRHIKATDFAGWIQGKYKFDDETLANVAGMLESYYKINIRFSTEDLKSIRFSSEFDSTDKLDDLLFAICNANNLTYTQSGQNILLSLKIKH